MFSGVALMAQNSVPYFCVDKGTVLEYTRKYTDGKVKWYHKMTMINVEIEEGKGVITYSSQLFNEKKKPYTDTPPEMRAIVDDGSISINIAETMTSIFKSALGEKRNIRSSGDMSLLPSDMEPGDSLPDAFCSVYAFGMTMNISVTKRIVLEYDTLDTPAGNFDCIVIRESKVEKGMGRNRRTTANTWYARSVGMVRHDTYNYKEVLETSEVLTSISNIKDL